MSKLALVIRDKSTVIKSTRTEWVCKNSGNESNKETRQYFFWYFACFIALALVCQGDSTCTLYWRCEVAKRVAMEETWGQGNISIWSNRDATLASKPRISNYHRLGLPGLLLGGALDSRYFDLNIVESESTCHQLSHCQRALYIYIYFVSCCTVSLYLYGKELIRNSQKSISKPKVCFISLFSGCWNIDDNLVWELTTLSPQGLLLPWPLYQPLELVPAALMASLDGGKLNSSLLLLFIIFTFMDLLLPHICPTPEEWRCWLLWS